MKKNEIQSEEFKVDSVPDLVGRITCQWRAREEEAVTLQRQQEAKLKTEIEKEKEITKRLKKARSLATKMEAEFSEIEARVEIEKKRAIEEISIREKDVKSGKVTLREFAQKGKSEAEISKMVIEESMDDIEQSLKVIRAKNIEILEIEKALYESQNLIRNLIIQPARILQRTLKDCGEITDAEIGLFLQDVYGNRDDVKLAEHRLLLCEGKSLSAGHRWDVSIKEAHKIQFDPIFPIELVPELKTELQKHEGTNGKIVVVFNLRSKDFHLQAFPRNRKRGDRIISMGDLKNEASQV